MSDTISPSYSILTTTWIRHPETSTKPVNSSTNTVVESSLSVASLGSNGTSSASSPKHDMLFMWVLIVSIGAAFLLVFIMIMFAVCCHVRRRRRTKSVSEAPKSQTKEKKRRGSRSLRNSIKRIFDSDGPLYAVSNLNLNRYSGIPTDGTRHNPNSTPDRSSPELPTSPDPLIPKEDRVIYEHYLSPVEGVPETETACSSSTSRNSEEKTYYEQMNELRSSRRFLQRKELKDESSEQDHTYLQPLHGIPVPDEILPKTSKSGRSLKPNIKPKPSGVLINDNPRMPIGNRTR